MAPEYVVVSAENNPAKTGMTLHSRRAFRSGELIFTEKPFIIIKNQPEAQFMKNLWKVLAKDFRKESRAGKEEHRIVEAFKLLSKEDQSAFLMLFNARQKLLTRAQNHVCSCRTAPGPTSVLELLGIYLTNLQFIHDDSTAVFKDISRINHACAANAYLKWNQRRGYMEVIAARDIPMSDVEITIDYSEKFASLIFSNAKDVRDHCYYFYGFWCRCLLCLRNIPQENSIVISNSKNHTDDETELYLDRAEELILTNRAYIDTIELNAAQEKEAFLFLTQRARGHISKKISEFPSRLETLFYDFGISWRTYGGNSYIRRRVEYHTALSQSSQNQSSTEESAKRSPISVRNNDLIDHLRLSESNEKEDVTSRVNLEESIGKKNKGDRSIEPLTVSLGGEAESKPRPVPLSKVTRRLSRENLKETMPLVHSGVNKCSVPYGTFNPIANPLEARYSKKVDKRLPMYRRSHQPCLNSHPVVPSINRSKKGYSDEINVFSGPQVNRVGCLSSVTQNLCKFGKGASAIRTSNSGNKTPEKAPTVNEEGNSAESEALAAKIREIFDRAAVNLSQAMGGAGVALDIRLPSEESVGTVNSLDRDLWFCSDRNGESDAREISPQQLDNLTNFQPLNRGSSCPDLRGGCEPDLAGIDNRENQHGRGQDNESW